MKADDLIILSADDDQCADVLMTTVFKRAGLVHPLRFVRDGEEAIAYLGGDGVFGDRARFPFPMALLLDLNMPRKDGFEVLAWIRQQPRLKRLHVYVLSGSNRVEDIERALHLGANAYLVKPGNLGGLMVMAAGLFAWLRLNHFSSMIDPAGVELPAPAPADNGARLPEPVGPLLLDRSG